MQDISHRDTSPDDDTLARSEARLRRAFTHAPFGMVVVAANGVLLEANDAFATMVGRTRASLLGRPEADLIVDVDPPQVLEWTSDGEPELVVSDRRYRHTDGHVVVARCTTRIERGADGSADGQLTHVADLTRLRAAEDALVTSEARFRRAFDESPIGMGLTSSDGRMLWVNDAYCVLLGRTWAEVVGRRASEFTHPADLPLAARSADKLLQGATTRGECELRYLRPDRSVAWARVSLSTLTDHDSGPPLVLAQVIDITDARQAEERLVHQAGHDALTGLPNRALLLDRLAQAIRRQSRSVGQVVVLYLDLDDFKVVNDGLGHAWGDDLLVEAAHRLRRCVRPSDTVARLGGDEFVMVCELEQATDVSVLCERVATVLSEPFEVDGRSHTMTASIGVVAADATHSPVELLRDADVAMYRSKAEGRGRTTLFTTGLRAEAVARLEQEADLRSALRHDQLVLHYQPVVSARDGRVEGAEALLRWEHPERGLLPPAELLATAERSDLVLEVGAVVLRLAVAQLAAWQRSGIDISLGVNLSPRQLRDGDVAGQILDLCHEAGADPEGLVLELTENAFIEALGTAGEQLRVLREAGVSIALDDFGTGYSSLQYLRDLPVDHVKIDRTFVQDLGVSDDGALAEAIVRLAAALDLVSVAEGVETTVQRERLRLMGCNHLQGFLLGRPAPADEIDLTRRW